MYRVLFVSPSLHKMIASGVFNRTKDDGNVRWGDAIKRHSLIDMPTALVLAVDPSGDTSHSGGASHPESHILGHPPVDCRP